VLFSWTAAGSGLPRILCPSSAAQEIQASEAFLQQRFMFDAARVVRAQQTFTIEAQYSALDIDQNRFDSLQRAAPKQPPKSNQASHA
jgi:hypothetical protein